MSARRHPRGLPANLSRGRVALLVLGRFNFVADELGASDRRRSTGARDKKDIAAPLGAARKSRSRYDQLVPLLLDLE